MSDNLIKTISGKKIDYNALENKPSILAKPIIASVVPTTSTVGEYGQIYIDSANNNVYQLINIQAVGENTTYTWKRLVVEDDLTPINNSISILSINYTDLTTALSTTNGNVTALSGRLTFAEANIDNLITDTTNYATAQNALTADLGTTKGRVTALETELTNNYALKTSVPTITYNSTTGEAIITGVVVENE